MKDIFSTAGRGRLVRARAFAPLALAVRLVPVPLLLGVSTAVGAMEVGLRLFASAQGPPTPNIEADSLTGAHPDGKDYQLGPSGNDLQFSAFWHLAGFLITKNLIFYIDTTGHAVTFRRWRG